MLDEKKTSKRLTVVIAILIATIICLTVATLALIMAAVKVPNNEFSTGTIAINMNDGKPVIDATDPTEEFKFIEPGMTIMKDFFVENMSSDSVYYRIYLENITGPLASVLEITIKDGDTAIYTGTAAGLLRNRAKSAGQLTVGERKDLTIWFHYPEDAGNHTQRNELTFNLCAEVVQTKNNNPEIPFN